MYEYISSAKRVLSRLLLKKVMGTPHENTFLCILRHLLRLDNANKMTSIIWEVIEKLVCRATVLDRDEFTIGGTLERYTQEKFKNIVFETQKQENDTDHVYELTNTKKFEGSPQK